MHFPSERRCAARSSTPESQSPHEAGQCFFAASRSHAPTMPFSSTHDAMAWPSTSSVTFATSSSAASHLGRNAGRHAVGDQLGMRHKDGRLLVAARVLLRGLRVWDGAEATGGRED